MHLFICIFEVIRYDYFSINRGNQETFRYRNIFSKLTRLLFYADKELTNSQTLYLDWLNKTSRLIRLSSLLVAQIGLTDTHTDISHLDLDLLFNVTLLFHGR